MTNKKFKKLPWFSGPDRLCCSHPLAANAEAPEDVALTPAPAAADPSSCR